MKVRELIKLLNLYNPEMEIYADDCGTERSIGRLYTVYLDNNKEVVYID